MSFLQFIRKQHPLLLATWLWAVIGMAGEAASGFAGVRGLLGLIF